MRSCTEFLFSFFPERCAQGRSVSLVVRSARRTRARPSDIPRLLIGMLGRHATSGQTEGRGISATQGACQETRKQDSRATCQDAEDVQDRSAGPTNIQTIRARPLWVYPSPQLQVPASHKCGYNNQSA